MNLHFEPSFDSGAWPGPLANSTATFGEAWLGTQGLLSLLETQLGLGGVRVSEGERLAALLRPLARTDGFHSRSFEVDPIGVARTLLHLRDALHHAGWTGQVTTGRLGLLAQLTRDLPPGQPERLSALISALDHDAPELRSLTVYGAKTCFSPLWQSLFTALAQHGTRLHFHDELPAQHSPGDLGAARSAFPGTFSPTGDGSLQLVRSHGVRAAAEEVAGFLGSAAAADFTVAGETIAYAGPDEWRYRRFVLHLAALAQAAGGVDAFLVGSEMVGLTRVRGAAGHPFVDGLADLTGEVRALLPGAILSYAADWTEYGGQARGADLDFPLDPLWAHPEIGAVGIDWYAPLADRRDDMPGSPYDVAALAEGFAAGEGFDWYYASDLDRVAGLRTPITDGLGKPWVHRQKDLISWWSNEHRPRIAGVEAAPTAWVPQSKPVWLTELGFPAVDRGANRPSVFPDRSPARAACRPSPRATATT